MNGFRITLVVDGKPLQVGGAMTLEKAREIRDVIDGALINDFDSRVSVFVEDA